MVSEVTATDLALADFDKALELDPQCAEAYGNRGLVQLLRENDVRAEADFVRCLALKPAEPSVLAR